MTAPDLDALAASPTQVDANDEAMVCTGCGTTRTVAAIRARSPKAFTCCPERKMVPVRAALLAAEQATAARVVEIEEAMRSSLIATGEAAASHLKRALSAEAQLKQAVEALRRIEAAEAWINDEGDMIEVRMDMDEASEIAASTLATIQGQQP